MNFQSIYKQAIKRLGGSSLELECSRISNSDLNLPYKELCRELIRINKGLEDEKRVAESKIETIQQKHTEVLEKLKEVTNSLEEQSCVPKNIKGKNGNFLLNKMQIYVKTYSFIRWVF